MKGVRSGWHGLVMLALFAAAPAAHAQWAVVDVGAIAQLVQQVSLLEQTLSTARNELSQAQQQYQAITGDRGMESLLGNSQRNYLPTSLADLAAVLANTSSAYSALAAQVQASIRANAILSASDLAALSPAEQQQVLAARGDAALLQALAGQALAETSARFASLQQLISAIASATDEKAALDLQARIGAEQTMLANDQSKLQALYEAAQAEELTRKMRLTEQAIADLGSMRSLPPMGL